MRLYEFPPTRSIRVRWTLQELGIPFEAVTVNLIAGDHHKPEFLALNPAAKIPSWWTATSSSRNRWPP